MVKYEVEHIRDECIGCGACACAAPKYWKMNDEGLSVLIGAKVIKDDIFILGPTNKDFELNEEAAICCPVNCIHIYEILDGDEKKRIA